MDFANILSQALNIVSTFVPLLGVSLFILCFIGEVIGVGIPYLLETSLMLTGYQVLNGQSSILDLLFILVMTQSGRLAGTMVLYGFGRSGGKLIEKIRLHIKARTNGNSFFTRMFNRINLLSPFSVAVGRLLWLRLPLTLVLVAQKKMRVLLLGTVISSFIYDCTYIVIGAVVGARTNLEPFQVVLYFLIGLTLIYLIFFMIHRLINRRSDQK